MYTFDSRVRYSETDSAGNLTLTGIVNYLQDCSVFQSNDLGIGVDYLVEHNMGWIITYWQIDINRRPHLGDRITIGTSPYGLKGFSGMRNFMIDTEEGERLVTVNSIWILMDLNKYMPLRIPEIFKERYEIFPKFEMDYLSRKIEIPSLEGLESEKVTVTQYDIDSNRHVNNSCYVNWAIDAIISKDKAFRPLDIKRLRVEYKKQVLLGETVTPVCFLCDDNCRIVEIVNSNDEICCVVELS